MSFNNGDVSSKGSLYDKKRAWNIVSTITIAIVLLGFLGWGLIDAIFGGQVGSVAVVGNKHISDSDFHHELEATRSQFSAQGIDIQSQHMLEQFVMRHMVFNLMIDQEMESAGFVIDDQVAIDLILNEKSINQEQLGNVSEKRPDLLSDMLQSKKRELFLKSINQAMLSNSVGSKFAIDSIVKFTEGLRTYSLFYITGSAIKHVPDATKADLLDIYTNDRSGKFIAKERKIVSFFDSDNLPNISRLSDEDILKHYNDRLGGKPEKARRDISVLFFKTKHDAEKASFMLDNGSSVKKVLNSFTGSTVDNIESIGIGDLSPLIAKDIFATPLNKPSVIINSSDNFIIGVTTKIYSTKRERGDHDAKSWASIKDAVYNSMKCDQVMSIRDQILDMISEGAAFDDVTQKLNILPNSRTVTEDTSPDSSLSDSMLELIKSNDVGYIGMDEDVSRCSVTFFNIKKIIKEKKKPFNEVRPKVYAIWRERFIDKALIDLYTKFLNRVSKDGVLKENVPLLNIARSSGIRFKQNLSANGRSISDQDPSLGVGFERDLLNGSPGSIIGPYPVGSDGDTYVIGVLHKVTPALQTDIQVQRKLMNHKVIADRNKDYQESYEKYLKEKYKVKIFKEYSHLAS